ncbi:MAG: hypothetical protein ACFBSF_21485 [Leptolyngbyaceae cyanobacterium]
MSEKIKLWEVQPDFSLQEISKAKLALEEYLEEWLENDISILSDELLVIGRQIKTYNGGIDLLCIDQYGDLIIIELKRDRTPREVTAQALDYASWVVNLSGEEVVQRAETYFNQRNQEFRDAFQSKFGTEIPDVINAQHRILIVGSEIDSSTKRIINYLSEHGEININAANFQYFGDAQGRNILARKFFTEPQVISERTKSKSKRRSKASVEDLRLLASENNAQDLFDHVHESFSPYFRLDTSGSTIQFNLRIDGSERTIFSLVPGDTEKYSALKFFANKEALAQFAKASMDELNSILPPSTEPHPNRGLPWVAGWIEDAGQIEKLQKQFTKTNN